MNSPNTTCTVQLIPLERIVTQPQIRERLLPESIKQMASSMRGLGQLASILVQAQTDGTYLVKDGHVRHEAALQLGWTTIRAEVSGSALKGPDMTAVQLATTECRFALNPMEQARAYDRYCLASGATAASLAALIGRSEAHVSRTKQLCLIRVELQELLAAGTIGASLALELDKVTDKGRFARLLQRANSGSLTRDELTRKRKSKPGNKSQRARLTISLGDGCKATFSKPSASVAGLLQQICGLADIARRAFAQSGEDLSAFMRIAAKENAMAEITG